MHGLCCAAQSLASRLLLPRLRSTACSRRLHAPSVAAAARQPAGSQSQPPRPSRPPAAATAAAAATAGRGAARRSPPARSEDSAQNQQQHQPPAPATPPSPPPRRASASRQKGGPVRLAKALADAGVASRRGAEALVFAGRVRVNGVTATQPQQLVTAGKDSLEVDGGALAASAPRHHYFALHKPAGYLCSNQLEGERLVLDLFAAWLARWKERHGGAAGGAARGLPPRLFTVGRLDAATSGLLLVTNDGAWAQKVAHPSSGVSKEYIITTAAAPTKRQLAVMLLGTDVDGAFVRPTRVERVVTPDGGGARRLLVEVVDGRNWEVRRLAEAAGVDVRHLRRTRVGGLRLPTTLKPGTFRELTFREAKTLLEPEAQEKARGGSVAAMQTPESEDA